MVNANSSETSNLDNTTNEVTAQDINDANKNKEHESVCPLSVEGTLKLYNLESLLLVSFLVFIFKNRRSKKSELLTALTFK